MKKIIILIITICLTIGLFIYAKSIQKPIDTNYEEIRSLEIRKSDILLQLDSLEREYDIKIHGQALTFLMFLDFNTKYYNDIIELFEKNNYYGTLVLSKDNFPGKENYLSVDQFNELIKRGWNYCILYEDEEQFDYISQLFKVNNMKTDTVYFNANKYSLSFDQRLKELGYKSIVHHGENGLNMYKDTIDNGIWHVGCMGLFGNSPKAKLIDTINVHGAFAYSVSFNKKNKDSYYDYETFNLVIDSFNTFVNKETLQVTDLERGYDYLVEINNYSNENKQIYNEMKTKLNKDLKDIEKQIKEIENNE